MTRREIIIVSVAAVVTLYGSYTYIFDYPAKKHIIKVSTGKKIQEANELVARASDLLKEGDEETITAYIVSLAEKKWIKDPFVREGEKSRNVVDERIERHPPEKEAFVYAGYLELGKRKVAVINGLDYEEGEEINGSGYFVRKITSSEVVLYDKQNKSKLAIPFVGE